ncbi:hypothetical protein JVU11DRAFT_5239 [Chiua virens]|nr:hypothetical protein JVU11DRAFT_5239 [Chiua virens]
MSYLNTIVWLHKKFTTRQRTAELLRPELENNVLSPHDYELAVRFLPGPRMNWHIIYGAGATAAVYGYGSYLARPKWSSWRLRLASVAAFLAGSTYGTFSQITLHYRFVNSLQDPQGFISAMNHVDERLGGSGRIGLTFQNLLTRRLERSPVPEHATHAPDTGIVSEEGWVQNQDSIDDQASMSDPGRLRTRWDEIRAANSRGAGQSTWDTIRQRHERSKLPDPPSPRPTDNPIVTEADERTAAQAKFDTLLEAERHRGDSQTD